jgi:hypothetical protein
MKEVELFKCKSPCGNCPYRKDGTLKLWHKSEYNKLKEIENSQFGSVYKCHKNNGSICVGWLMKQDENNLPSIALRIALTINKVTREYLNNLKSPSELYENIDAMIKANYPKIK